MRSGDWRLGECAWMNGEWRRTNVAHAERGRFGVVHVRKGVLLQQGTRLLPRRQPSADLLQGYVRGVPAAAYRDRLQITLHSKLTRHGVPAHLHPDDAATLSSRAPTSRPPVFWKLWSMSVRTTSVSWESSERVVSARCPPPVRKLRPIHLHSGRCSPDSPTVDRLRSCWCVRLTPQTYSR